jgi:hypothetical protein
MPVVITLSDVLCGRECSSVMLTEEHRSRVFEDRVPRGTFGSKTESVNEGWTKLHCRGRHNFCISPNIIGLLNKCVLYGTGMYHACVVQ